MTTQLAVRFADEDVQLLDEMVKAGVGANRTEIVRLAIGRLVTEERHRRAIAAEVAMWAEFPETADELERSKANVVDYCAAENWSDIYPPTVGPTTGTQP